MTAAFSPDESKIVSASADRTIRVWNIDGTGEPLVLEGHEGLVWSADFSPDGTRIVSASSDWTARVWNADGTGEPIFLGWYQGPVWHAAFSDDGSRIATASAERVVHVWRLWRLDWPELVATLRRGSNACLTPEHRSRFLLESPEDAREAYEACERGYGREPVAETGE
jgi:WD40 repeat protein